MGKVLRGNPVLSNVVDIAFCRDTGEAVRVTVFGTFLPLEVAVHLGPLSYVVVHADHRLVIVVDIGCGGYEVVSASQICSVWNVRQRNVVQQRRANGVDLRTGNGVPGELYLATRAAAAVAQGGAGGV